MGWTVFQRRREQWARQRYQLAPESLRSRPQLEYSAHKTQFFLATPLLTEKSLVCQIPNIQT